MRETFLLILLVGLLFFAVACRKNSSNANHNSNANSNKSVSSSSKGQTKSDDAQMLYDEGDQLFQSDHDKEAIEAFKRAIAVDPNFADAHFKLALSYAAVERIEESREEFKKAIDAYKKIVEANPDDVEAYFNMGRSYARMNLFESAAGAFRQAARIKKDDADIYYELGIVQIKLAQYNDAISSLNKSLEIDPENYRASEALEDAKAGKQRITSYVKHQEDLDKKEKEKTANANMTAPKPE